MANTSTDELCNTHHAIVQALRLELQLPFPNLADRDAMLDVELAVRRLVERRTGHAWHAPESVMHIPFRGFP